jgi:DNA-3-methyladenine glycosylase I
VAKRPVETNGRRAARGAGATGGTGGARGDRETAGIDGSDTRIRCGWCGDDPLYRRYHDREWGVPLRDDRRLFEFLILEGAQAGLAWITILRKRDRYRQVFAGFDPVRVARFTPDDVARLLQDAGIVRNRLKVAAAVTNAQAYLQVAREFGSFSDYIWSFTGGEVVQNRWRRLQDIPAETDGSRRLSRDLRKRGFRFVGPTICYAFMQAVGMVNDHLVGCYRHRELGGS